jgi:hypothetical protein
MLVGRNASLSQSNNIKIKDIAKISDSSKNYNKCCYANTESLQTMHSTL